MERIEIEKKLKKELNKDRFRHTLGVMYTAASLAMVHGVDIEQALYAGLLHDCAKCIPNKEQLKLCKEKGITVTESEERSPYLLHAKLGAYLAKKKYDITDKEILHAIQVHTTGAPDMSPLDMIIYIADYIEPNRDKAPNLVKIRKKAFENLEETMLMILSDTLNYLEQSEGVIDPMTALTYEYFKNKEV